MDLISCHCFNANDASNSHFFVSLCLPRAVSLTSIHEVLSLEEDKGGGEEGGGEEEGEGEGDGEGGDKDDEENDEEEMKKKRKLRDKAETVQEEGER